MRVGLGFYRDDGRCRRHKLSRFSGILRFRLSWRYGRVSLCYRAFFLNRSGLPPVGEWLDRLLPLRRAFLNLFILFFLPSLVRGLHRLGLPDRPFRRSKQGIE
jgi:hypothetical protein